MRGCIVFNVFFAKQDTFRQGPPRGRKLRRMMAFPGVRRRVAGGLLTLGNLQHLAYLQGVTGLAV